MKAIVHIGMPKTGTTAIQNWLKINARALLRQGVLYDRVNMPGVKQYIAHVELHLAQMTELDRVVPSKQMRGSYGISDLADQKRVVRRFERRLKRILEANRNADRFVFSSEQVGIATGKPKAAKAMHAWIRRTFDEAHYVIYYRRQEDWVTSNYVQTLRRGQTHGFLDYCSSKKMANHGRVAQHFAKVAGQENVTVRITEPDVLVDGDVIADFAAICGVSHAGLKPPPKSNESLSAAAAEVLRYLNEKIPTFDGATRNRLSQKAARNLADLSVGGARFVLPESMRAEIREANAEANERIRTLWFPERTELFPERSSQPALTKADPMEVVEIAQQLRKKMGKAIEPYIAELTKELSPS